MNEVKLNTTRARIGHFLKSWREKTGQNQAQIAAAAGISTSMLSQIERGIVSPSIDTLMEVCAALDIDMGVLFERVASRRVAHVHHRGERLTSSQQGITYEQLVSSYDTKYPMEMFMLEVASGHDTGICGQGHEGVEMGYVLSGKALLTIDQESYSLGCGDSISFASHRPHRLSNTGDTVFKAIWSVSPPHQNFLDALS
ncbi:MAG: helix-turn-helix domain-containing protein [Chitinivibrionales bacterium]